MLYLIVYYFSISFICLWVGLLINSVCALADIGKKNIIKVILTGLIVLTCIGQWLVLFIPITLFTSLICLIAVSFISLLYRKRLNLTISTFFQPDLKKPVLFYVCLTCSILAILVLNAGPVLMDDTGSYHIQMIKWIQEYGSVPGIANLHLRFGFNSSWFTSIALFGMHGNGFNAYGALNGLLSAWVCYYLLDLFFTGFKSQTKSHNGGFVFLILFIICFLNWPMIRGTATGANYDFITTCCIVVLFGDISQDQKEVSFEWFLWPAYLFTVRMLNFPLLVLSVLYMILFLKSFTGRKNLTLIAILGFVILPFLIRNCILSGYVFFPVYQLDLFSFDWKVDRLKLVEISKYVKYFNRVNPMFQPLSITQNISFPGWIKSWFLYLFRFDRMIVVLSIVGYLSAFFYGPGIKNRIFRIFIYVMILQLAVWFFIAPDPRFVYGPLLFGIFAGLKDVRWLGILQGKIIKYILISLSAVIFAYTLSKVIIYRDYRNYLTPNKIPVPKSQKILIGTIEMHIPEKILNNWNPRCYDIALPCLYIPDTRLEARGKDISAGFRLKKTDNYIFNGGEYKIID
jgi:hypothetical protein